MTWKERGGDVYEEERKGGGYWRGMEVGRDWGELKMTYPLEFSWQTIARETECGCAICRLKDFVWKEKRKIAKESLKNVLRLNSWYWKPAAE